MSLEFEDRDPALRDEPADYTKWIWLGVVLLVAVLVAIVVFSSRPDPGVSRIRAKHILVKANFMDPVHRQEARRRIEELRDRILKGERFEDLARQYSQDPYSSARGGDLGYKPPGSFEEEFEKYVWTAPLGKLGDVVQTKHGYHLIVVVDRHVATHQQGQTDPASSAPAGSNPSD